MALLDLHNRFGRIIGLMVLRDVDRCAVGKWYRCYGKVDIVDAFVDRLWINRISGPGLTRVRRTRSFL
ncbi:hypothetical protein AB395_00006283 (plasmid) [Sinorhizobium fredii CCBAU 45436]|nr:hypothetical protein AB395_00006283 [Sinorhizobium fredii CCBAU 45436]